MAGRITTRPWQPAGVSVASSTFRAEVVSAVTCAVRLTLKEFAAAKRGYTFASHQQEVGAGYFDDVTTVIEGGSSSVTALRGSTEEEQF